MNYLNAIIDYPIDELSLHFRDGKIVAENNYAEEVRSARIGSIRVIMEEVLNVLGIRRIMKCSILTEKDELVHDDSTSFAEMEFNYADGNADIEVAECVASKYRVPLEFIEIELS